MKVVVDTNVLLKSLPKKSRFHPIFDALRAGQIELLLTTDILLEYVEILGAKTNATVANNVGNFLLKLPQTTKVEVFIRWKLITFDPDDDKFVDCAIAGNADFIVTDDGHFKVLKSIEFPEIQVIDSESFLSLLVSK